MSYPLAHLLPAKSSFRGLLHLLSVVLAAVLLLGCCPVPTGSAVDTAFNATVASVSPVTVTVSLGDGRQVRLVPRAAGQLDSLGVGQRIHVEGTVEGEIVLVERLIVLVLADSPETG